MLCQNDFACWTCKEISGQEIFGKSPYWKNADNRRLIELALSYCFHSQCKGAGQSASERAMGKIKFNEIAITWKIFRTQFPVGIWGCAAGSRLRQTANVNLYHVTKFIPYFSFTVYCFYTKIDRFMPVLSKRIVLDCFYLLIFYFEKFSTAVCRLPCAVNVNLNLSIGRIT